METDPTEIPLVGERHPTLAELKNASHPSISEHLASCSMCRSVIAADDEIETSEPIPLDLPKGLVSENAFKWPADPIARGGMAQIFSGEDRRLGRSVILKSPREGDDLPAGMGEMFQRRVTAEARVLAKLQHPSIVTIYELGKATVGWPFCVLEKVDGIALRDRLDEIAEAEASDGKPRTRERLELLSSLVSIAEALAYAHERRVVHRDCTPNNILLGKRGEATLIDWGIARDLDAPGGTTDPSLRPDESPAASGVTISAGTPPYLPYEQTQGRQADPSFDVYSFGITLYEVVSGRTPFEWHHVHAQDARTKQLGAFLAWLKSGAEAPPAMPRDPELSGIIARAMAGSPSSRFTADELVRALKQYLTGDLVFSHRYSTTGRLARWAGRHRAATVAVVSLVLFAIGGGFVWAQLSRRAQQEAELRAIASAARADASEKGREADQANREAEAAEALADQAKKESKDSDAMRREAERKRRAAEDKRRAQQAAELRAIASSARAAASDKGREADQANREAEAAEALADQAKKESKDADAMRREAERKRKAAEDKRREFEQAALHAKDDAEDAFKRYAEAEKDKDEANRARDAARAAEQQARTAQLVAEKDRDTAHAARDVADKERDAARASAAAAEADREAARATAASAEKERDAARTAQLAAEKERDAAIAARASVEKERDEARRKLAGLEQRLRDRDREPVPAPGPQEPPVPRNP